MGRVKPPNISNGCLYLGRGGLVFVSRRSPFQNTKKQNKNLDVLGQKGKKIQRFKSHVI
jgi:hypothetical protein